MKKRTITILLAVMMVLSLLPTAAFALEGTYGDMTYHVTNGAVTIDSCAEVESGKVVIPDMIDGYPVTAIGAYAFNGHEELTSIKLPDSIVTIGEYAFAGCDDLESITIPEGVTAIPAHTFDNCCALVDVNLPESLTTIGAYAFFECIDLTVIAIPEGVASFGANCFSDCHSLSDFVIPDGVKKIPNRMFFDCFSLENVGIPSSVTQIGDGAFRECEDLSDVYYSGNESAWNAITVGTNNKMMTDAKKHFGAQTVQPRIGELGRVTYKINITGTAAIIASQSIEGAVKIPAKIKGYPVTLIDDYAFIWNSHMTQVTLPDSITAIGEEAFYACWELERINLPNGLTSIGYCAFRNCNLKSVVMPDTVTEVSGGLFSHNDQLSEVVLFKNLTELPYMIPEESDDPDDVAEGFFDHCVSLKQITIPAAMTRIDDLAFYDCSGLEQVTILGPLSEIGDAAFYGCNALKDVWFSGTKAQWNAIAIGSDNTPLNSAAIHYNYQPLSITTQPKNVSTVEGKTVTMKVAATGSGLKYQWQYKSSDGTWKNTTLEGNQTATLSIPATVARNGNQYRCVIQNGRDTVTSNAAKITVLGIMTQPANISTTVGKTVTMKVVATGSNLTYQWQYKASDGTWKNTTLSGNQTATLSIPATYARSGNVYRCVVKSGSNSVNSNPAKLTVFGIKTQPANVSAPIGKTVTMKVVATGSNLTYQWQYKTDSGTWKNTTLEGAKTATLKIPVTAARNGNVYRCVVKCGNASVNSNAAKVTVFAIKTQPTNVTAVVGKTVTMKVVATGTNLTYQWQYKAADGTWKNTTLTGAKTATLSIPATKARNGNVYRCVVKCGAYTLNSSTAKLTVK